ncbi:2585_t:CDS:2, partial [Racocetra fulgida]
KRIEFGSAMSMAKTGVQIAIAESATLELIGLLTQFITKYRRNTRLNEIYYPTSQTNGEAQPLSNITNHNLPKVTNPEYHKPKGRPPKHLKSSTKENN